MQADQPLDPVEWAHDDAGTGVFALDAFRAIWKRKALVAAAVVLAVGLPLAWFYLRPYGFRAQQEILFGQTLDADERTLVLSVASGPGAARAAADAAATTPEQLRLAARIVGARTLLVSLEHRNRATAMAGLDAVADLVRSQASLSSRLQSPLSAEPRRFGSDRVALLAAAGLFGWFLGVAAAWTLDRRDRRILSLAELEQVTGLPILILSEETSSHVS